MKKFPLNAVLLALSVTLAGCSQDVIVEKETPIRPVKLLSIDKLDNNKPISINISTNTVIRLNKKA